MKATDSAWHAHAVLAHDEMRAADAAAIAAGITERLWSLRDTDE